MSITIQKFNNEHELFYFAAKDFVKKAELILKDKNYFDVALAGGSTAQSFFAILAQELSQKDFLSHLRFFLSDEREVDLSSKDSNSGNALRNLIKPLGLNNNNFFPLYDFSCSLEEAAIRYEHKLKELLPLNSNNVPTFDLLYLGLGTDGHIASLFPKSPLLLDKNSLIAATEQSHNGFRRLTFMPQIIKAAKNICIMAPGKEKALLIKELLNINLDIYNIPAHIVFNKDLENSTILQTK
jgi:6-phosphogluconolactonase